VADDALVVKSTANTCAFAQRDLPPETTLIECVLDPGTDAGQTWGLGLGLAWDDNRFLRIHLRTADRRFGYDDGRQVYFGPAVALEPQRVRIRLEAEEVLLEYFADTRHGADQWRRIGRFDRSAYPGYPTSVRIGKMDQAGRKVDFPSPGAAGVCRARPLQIWGNAPAR